MNTSSAPLSGTDATPLPRPRRHRWIPVRSLAPQHRPRIQAHLLALAPADRYLRFGYIATDEQIGRYVEQLDFSRDEIFGVFSWRLELVAMAHLAHHGAGGMGRAEFGVSVLASHRKLGMGARLLDHAILHARNRSVDTLVIHALSENKPMLALARLAGAEVHWDGPEAEAVLKLPPEDLSSQLSALVSDTAAQWDFGVKQQAMCIDMFLKQITQPTARGEEAAEAAD